MKKTIILDFDYTLFDAATFKTALAQSLKSFNIDEKLFFKTYKEIRYDNGKEIDYKPDKHLEKLAAITHNDFNILSKAYFKILDNCQKYLYLDSLAFIKKQIANHEKLILLTFGNPEFQEKKVLSCNLEKYFTEIFYTDKPKITLAHEIIDTDNTIFINDNPREIQELQQIYKHAKFVLIKRKNGKKYNHDYDFDQVKVIYNLNELE